MNLRIGERMRAAAIAPLRLLMPRHPGWRLALFVLLGLLLLSLLAPGVNLLLRLAELLVRMSEPLLATTIGRVALTGLLLALALCAGWGLARGRIRRYFDDAAVGRHLAAVADLAVEESDRARVELRRVAKRRSAPTRCPWIAADASLKLARDALARDHVEEALGWLERVPEAGLPVELVRSHWQLRAVAWRRQGAALPTQLQVDVDKALARFPGDATLAEEALALAVRAGDPIAIGAAHDRCVHNANPGARNQAIARRLAWLQSCATEQLARGDLAAVRRIAKELGEGDPSGVGRDLLLGDAHAAAGEAEKALAKWGATRSWEAIERAAALLDRQPDAVEPSKLLALLPMQGALLLVARQLARRGDAPAAERAARQAALALGPTPTTLRMLADVAAALGRTEEAARLLAGQVRPPDAGDGSAG